MHQNDDKTPTVDELATEFGVTREEIIYAMDASHMPISLFDTGDNDGLSLGEKIVGTDDKDVVDKMVLHSMLKDLPTRDKKNNFASLFPQRDPKRGRKTIKHLPSPSIAYRTTRLGTIP